jgi:hypothetical protein
LWAQRHFSDRHFKTVASFCWICLFRFANARRTRLLPSEDAALAQNLLDAPDIVNTLFMNFITPPLSATFCTFQATRRAQIFQTTAERQEGVP